MDRQFNKNLINSFIEIYGEYGMWGVNEELIMVQNELKLDIASKKLLKKAIGKQIQEELNIKKDI